MRYSLNNYSNQVINGKKSIWLQYYGWAEAKPAEEFKPGEFMKWNGGSENKVVAVAMQTKATITFILETKDGHAQRKFNKKRWVAIGFGKNF